MWFLRQETDDFRLNWDVLVENQKEYNIERE